MRKTCLPECVSSTAGEWSCIFSAEGEIETGNNCVTSSSSRQLNGSARPENDNRRLQVYNTHIFFDFTWNLGILVTIVI